MEIVKGVRVVPGTPIAYIPEYRILVFSDLHLGFEESLASSGVYIPKVQLSKILPVIEKTLENNSKVETVVINGDVKHSFHKLTWQEKVEVRKLLKVIKNYVEDVVIVRGNHDNFLPIILKEFNTVLTEDFKIGRYYFTHGHKSVNLNSIVEEVVVIGHEHPSIALKDDIGYVTKFPCFLAGKLRGGKEILVLPAMSLYASGTNATTDRLQYLSPIIREYGIVEEFKPYIFEEEVGVLELPELKSL